MDPAILTIDIGTGSARAGLVDLAGNVRALHAVPHRTHYPNHSWVEQEPEVWWSGARQSIRSVMSSAKKKDIEVKAVVTCGQTHAAVLLDSAGRVLTKRALLWNDKRAAPQSNAIRNRRDYEHIHQLTANPAAPSWPGVKLAWYNENARAILDAASVVLMPKDFINYKLCGELAWDRTEAGYSYLYSWVTNAWDEGLCQLLGVRRDILPKVMEPSDQVGRVTKTVADETGIPPRIPVLVGAGDYPTAVLGSGVCRTGEASDITGTSSLLTVLTEAPLTHPDVMNTAAAVSGCLAFSILDAAGDAVRWGRRELENDRVDLTDLTARAAGIPPGSEGLLFLPYLTGERLGQGPGSRAAFLGLTAGHGKPHMHRAISEGVAMGLKYASTPQLESLGVPDRIVAAGGGAYSQPLLQMKANVFNVPFLPVSQVECGLLGGAAMAFSSLNYYSGSEEAAAHLVRYSDPIEPDPASTGRYEELFEIFCRARESLQDINTSIGELAIGSLGA